MFSIKTVFLLLVVVSQVASERKWRPCPACLDEDLFLFLNFNYNFFPIDYIYHIQVHNLTELKCSKNWYTTVLCNQSCVSIHLKLTDKKGTNTVGWAFDCSTDIVYDIPFKIPNAPKNLTNYDGRFNYIDTTGIHNFKNTYEIAFYSNPGDVQTTREYYQEEEDKKNRVVVDEIETTTQAVVETTTHQHKDCECHNHDHPETTTQAVVIPTQQRDESEFHGEDSLNTTTQLMVKQAEKDHHFLIGLCGFVLILIVILKFVNYSKNRNQNQNEELKPLRTSIAFKKLDDSMEGETIIVPPVNPAEDYIA